MSENTSDLIYLIDNLTFHYKWMRNNLNEHTINNCSRFCRESKWRDCERVSGEGTEWENIDSFRQTRRVTHLSVLMYIRLENLTFLVRIQVESLAFVTGNWASSHMMPCKHHRDTCSLRSHSNNKHFYRVLNIHDINKCQNLFRKKWMAASKRAKFSYI